MNFTRRILTLALSIVLCVGILSTTASAAENTMYGIGFVNTSSLRLRAEASTTSAVLATAPKNDCVVIISKTGDWYKVSYNLQEGYMHASYLDAATKENAELGIGKVTGSGVNLRSGPSTSYGVSAVVPQGASCYIIGLNEGWYKVIYQDTTCYIRSDYLELTEYPYENQKSPNTPKYFRRGASTGVKPNSSASTAPSTSAGTARGSEILAEAQKYIGTAYAAGGASPSGFDCSGYVYYVLKQLGYSPYRTPADQYKMGAPVSQENLKKGDIVFFAGTYASGISHVGIYAGNGQFLHAPNSRSTVSYSSLTSGYWADHYYGARRVG